LSDQRLRSAERAAAHDSSADAQAAWLKERLRAGTTTPDLVELAAYCGHAGAGLLSPDRRNEDLALEMWVAGLTHWHDALPGIAVTLAAEAAFPKWIERHQEVGRPRDPGCEPPVSGRLFGCPARSSPGTKCLTIERVKRAVETARVWVDCLSFPCLEHVEACRLTSAAIGSNEPGFAVWLGLGIFHHHEDDGLNLFMQALRSALREVAGVDCLTDGAEDFCGPISAVDYAEEKLLVAGQAAVLEWALRELR